MNCFSVWLSEQERIAIKRKYFLMMLIGIILILCFLTAKSFYENYSLGNRDEREELLVAVMFDLTKNDDILKEDIKLIDVVKHSDGLCPFNYEVIIDLKDNIRITYQWENDRKTKVMISSSLKL